MDLALDDPPDEFRYIALTVLSTSKVICLPQVCDESMTLVSCALGRQGASFTRYKLSFRGRRSIIVSMPGKQILIEVNGGGISVY